MDENELIKMFCKSANCHECEGTDQYGEPNGYGCDALERFLDERCMKEVAHNDACSPIDACWYCGKNDGEMLFSTEFDTYLHEHCLKKTFETYRDPEAWIFMHEFNFVTSEEWDKYLKMWKEYEDTDNYNEDFLEQ